MFEKIPVPVKGQPARASWGAGITNRVNEIGAMFPSRGLARDGATGTGFAPLPANRRDRRGVSVDNGCWAVDSVSVTDQHIEYFSVSFRNRFFSVGGITYECDSGLMASQAYPGAIVALVITMDGEEPSPHVGVYSSLTEMNRANTDPGSGFGNYCIPLYQFGSGGSVMVDFRNMPLAAAWRFQ